MYIPDRYLAKDPLQLTRNRFLQRTVAPSGEPLTLNEVKLYLRIDHEDEDALLTDMIVAARMVAENWLKRSLITQSWKLAYDDGIPECVWLPLGPVASITSVVIVNKDASSQTISSSAYWLNAAKNAMLMDSTLIGFRIEITYSAGYGAAANVPLPIKQGMLAHIAAMYESRGDGEQLVLPGQAVGLYMPFREVRL